METPVQVNVAELVDNSKIGAYQIGIFILCGICLIMDGFDVQAIGYVAPAIVQDWHIPNSELGPVFSAALLGLLIGSLLFSQIADKIGRRPVLISCTLCFSLLAFFTARSSSIGELITLRLVGGIFMGAIMPNVAALVGEYSPLRKRVSMIMVVTNSFTIGAAIGGVVSAWLIGSFGWRAVFYFGSVIPLVAAVLMIFWLPESLPFLVLRGKNPARIGALLKRIGQTVPASAHYILPEKPSKGVPIAQLFREGRALGTILLSIIYCMNVINLYFLSTWLPTVAKAMGYSTSTAVYVGTVLQVGGAIGAVALTVFVGRFGFGTVLITCFLVACVSVGSIGLPALTLTLLFVVVFVAGWCIFGSQAILNAFAAMFYATDVRSTGVGWGLGVSRFGAILGPLVAGELIRRQWQLQSIFFVAAVPALLSAIAAFALGRMIPAHGSRPDGNPALVPESASPAGH